MLFSEVYGTYYNVLATLLDRAVEGTLTRESMEAVIREQGFEESILSIPQALERQTWPLIRPDCTTPLRHKPAMPLTDLQKRWLKALLIDPRIRLFDPPLDGLEDVQPLYPADAFVYYDRYQDGDPFTDPGYITRFRRILSAIRHRRRLRVRFTGSKGLPHTWKCIPHRLEYSAKDDKFRLICSIGQDPHSINLARITDCVLLEPFAEEAAMLRAQKQQTLVLELKDERNALERVLLHFSHLNRQTERIGEDTYRVTLFYAQEDEAELLIRVLSFGPVLKVLYPDEFQKKLVCRLEKQKNLRIRK